MKMDIIQKYERIIKSQQAILFAQGPPGMAKTAIFNYIANRQKWNYIDLRLATRDSSEVIGIPQTFAKLKDGREIPCTALGSNTISIDEVVEYFIKITPPEWAVKANERPTLVVFEELNRATLEVRNAALQILLERRVGESFQLNENVFFASTGNMGDLADNKGDGCEVEEFDNALKGRLFFIEHFVTIDEWKLHFANENINPIIISFLESHPDHCFKLTEDHNSYASYRGWTFLSNFIGKNETDIEKIITDVNEFGMGYVGISYVIFSKYLDTKKKLTVKDILENFDKIKGILDQFPRDQTNEVIENLKKIRYEKLSDKKINNLIKFLDTVHEDLRVSYFRFVNTELVIGTVIPDSDPLDVIVSYKTPNIEKLVNKLQSRFEDELDCILENDEKEEEE